MAKAKSTNLKVIIGGLLHCDQEGLRLRSNVAEVYNSNCEKLLGVKFDNKLKFNEHVSGLCKKASQKLHVLARIAHYMIRKKRRIIMKAFINSQFGYCPLIWMFHDRTLNRRINKIQERALCTVYDDQLSTNV